MRNPNSTARVLSEDMACEPVDRVVRKLYDL
jgi:hypothetical protein